MRPPTASGSSRRCGRHDMSSEPLRRVPLRKPGPIAAVSHYSVSNIQGCAQWINLYWELQYSAARVNLLRPIQQQFRCSISAALTDEQLGADESLCTWNIAATRLVLAGQSSSSLPVDTCLPPPHDSRTYPSASSLASWSAEIHPANGPSPSSYLCLCSRGSW